MVFEKCNSEVTDNANFCPSCGNKLEEHEVSQRRNNYSYTYSSKVLYLGYMIILFFLLIFGLNFFFSLILSSFVLIYSLIFLESYLKTKHFISQNFSINNIIRGNNNFIIKPKLIIIIILNILIMYLLGINFFISIILDFIFTTYLLLKHEIFLKRNSFLSNSLSLSDIMSKKRNRVIYSVLSLIFLSVLIYGYLQSTQFYQNYIFRREVKDLIIAEDEKALNKIFYEIDHTKESDSLNFLVLNSFTNSKRLLKDAIEKNFWKLPPNLQDTLINFCLVNKIQFFSDEYICEQLYGNIFIISNNRLSKIINTHSSENLVRIVEQMLRIDIKYINVINPVVKKDYELIIGYMNYFSLKNDSLWKSISINLWKVDSLQSYLNSLICSEPSKPIYDKPEYSGPEYISGGVIPYDGDGVLVYTFDDGKFRIIEGASKDPYPMFTGYANWKGQKTTVYSKVNGRTWDAAVYEYVSNEEYNDGIREYQTRLHDSIIDYKEELNNYNLDLAKYKFYLKNEPIIKNEIKTLIEDTKLLL